MVEASIKNNNNKHWAKKRICLSLLVEQIYCKFWGTNVATYLFLVQILFKSESLLFCKGGVNVE